MVKTTGYGIAPVAALNRISSFATFDHVPICATKGQVRIVAPADPAAAGVPGENLISIRSVKLATFGIWSVEQICGKPVDIILLLQNSGPRFVH